MQALDLILRLLNVNMDIFSLYYSYSGNEISYNNVTFDIYFSSFIKQKIDKINFKFKKCYTKLS